MKGGRSPFFVLATNNRRTILNVGPTPPRKRCDGKPTRQEVGDGPPTRTRRRAASSPPPPYHHHPPPRHHASPFLRRPPTRRLRPPHQPYRPSRRPPLRGAPF